VLLPKEELEAAAAMCAAAGTWLILDNTYEDFLYEGRRHHTVSGQNVISVFSFSKAYGEADGACWGCFLGVSFTEAAQCWGCCCKQWHEEEEQVASPKIWMFCMSST
jgi:aspartate/methionine/tyrosine aminotransferase